jgi:hypothetical protein
VSQAVGGALVIASIGINQTKYVVGCKIIGAAKQYLGADRFGAVELSLAAQMFGLLHGLACQMP